ncbi:MAG TPA: hypothetical protein VFL17_00985, partial [Anaerolineae bacterium]|nr:hypothetical protein [Anaerolineae bacterium]
MRRSNLSRHERTWPSVQEIASHKALAMTRAEQLRGIKELLTEPPIIELAANTIGCKLLASPHDEELWHGIRTQLAGGPPVMDHNQVVARRR